MESVFQFRCSVFCSEAEEINLHKYTVEFYKRHRFYSPDIIYILYMLIYIYIYIYNTTEYKSLTDLLVSVSTDSVSVIWPMRDFQ